MPGHRWIGGAVCIALLLSGCQKGHGVEGPAITVSGHRLVGSRTTVSYVLTDSRDPLHVAVYGSVDGKCVGKPDPVIRATVRETPAAVTLDASRYGPDDAGGACAGVGLDPSPVTVALRTPIARRDVRDARDGRAVPHRDLASVPTIDRPPAGFRARPWDWNVYSGFLFRVYLAGSTRQIRLTVSTTGLSGLATSTSARHVVVRGRAGFAVRQYSAVGPTVQWSPRRGVVVTLDAGSSGLTFAQVMALADTVR